MAWARQWWGQSHHFRWLSGYVGYRNLRGFARRIMAAVVASLGAVPLLVMWTPDGPRTLPGPSGLHRRHGVLRGDGDHVADPWPSRRQSVLFVVLLDVCIAAACLVYSTPGMSLLSCTALAGYVAFFHTSRYLALVLLTAAAVSVASAVEIAMSAGVLVGLAKLLIIAVGVLAFPFCGHVLMPSQGARPPTTGRLLA